MSRRPRRTTSEKLIRKLPRDECPFVFSSAMKKMGLSSVGDIPKIELPFGENYARAIEIDPPWQYKDCGYNGFDSVQKHRIHCPYPTMSLPEIWAMGSEINRVASENCHLWTWTTKDFMEASLELVRSWGWETKQIFTWIKTTNGFSRNHSGMRGFSGEQIEEASPVLEAMGLPGKPKYGMGSWGRNGCEYLILAVNNSKKSNSLLPAKNTIPNYFFAPTAGHSAKPEKAYDLIKSLSPGPRLSIFQRTEREGFECWGNEMSQALPEDVPGQILINGSEVSLESRDREVS